LETKKVTNLVNLNKEPYDILICRPSKWGNPFTHIKDKQTLAEFVVGSREEAIAKYREYILASPELMDSLDELDGKTISCFCPPKSCHGDVLMELLSQKKLKAFLNK